MFLEEVEEFSRIRPGNSQDLERLSNLLDLLNLNLRESNLEQELGSGLLFLKLQQKLDKRLLSLFHRWLHEQRAKVSVMTLWKFILLEAEFEIIAEETTKGLSKLDSNKNVFLSVGENKKQPKTQKCPICHQDHEVQKCPRFISADMDERTYLVHKHNLCFACLAIGHKKQNCKQKITCEICKHNHNTLFHRDVVGTFYGQNNPLISL